MEGFQDLTLNGYGFKNILLYCDENYNKSCELNYDNITSEVICNSTKLDGKYCESFISDTNSPTNIPTNLPTNNPTNVPTLKPTYFGIDEETGCIQTCGDIGCNTSEKNPYCSNFANNGNCIECFDGYWRESNLYPCVSCTSIEGCLECNNFSGCNVCKNGYTKKWDTNCGYGIYICVFNL